MHQAYGSQSAAAAYMQSSTFYNSPAYGMLQQGYHSAAGMYELRRQLCVCVCVRVRVRVCVCARAHYKCLAVLSTLLLFFH